MNLVAPESTASDAPRTGCPYCGSVLREGNVCPNCGIICERCGTPYKGRSCPECGSSSLVVASSSPSPEAPENTAFGEVAPEFHETRGIFDRKWIGRREWNMMRGTFATADGKQVHDRALEAVAQLALLSKAGLSSQAQAMLLERVEQVAKSLLRRFSSVEKAVMFAFSAEAQGMGVPVVSVQNALGKAGFTIRFGSILVKVWTAEGKDAAAAAIVVKVNGESRAAKAQESNDDEDGRLRLSFGDMGTICKVRVPLLLTDSLSADAGRVMVDFGDGTEIVSFEPKFGAGLASPSTLRLQLKPEKAFGVFKVKKQVIALIPDQGASPIPSANADPRTTVDLYARRFLPSSRFPRSAELLRRAGRLGTVEKRFAELFRARMKEANGRMPERLARRALFDADAEAFQLLPPTRRRAVRLLVAGMNLPPGDRRYTGLSGLLVPSEVGGRPT